MPKTRKQRGGVARKPKKQTYSQRRALERKQIIGRERPRIESTMNWVKPRRPGQSQSNVNMGKLYLAANKAIKQSKKKKVRKLNLTVNIRRNNSTSDYIKSIKTLLHKTNEILREPTEDYDVALEIAEELKKELNELEESLGATTTALTDRTSGEKVVERVIYLVDKYSNKPKKVILIAVTVDGVVTKAKAAGAPAAAASAAAGAPAENANVGELTAMLATLRPFKA
jgi:primosomal protein N'